jgi:hypothetical protein
MRKHLGAVVVIVSLLACNGDSLSPVGPASLESHPSPAIADAKNGGREGFYFLHPFVANPGVVGPFDATLLPSAQVCVLNAARTECSAVILATIPTSGLSVGSNGVFVGQWVAPATLDLSTISGNEARYRLEILLDVGSTTVTLGYADFWVTEKQQDVKDIPAGYANLVRGKNLVFRFGILSTTVGYVVVTPNPVQLTIGGTQQMTATAFDVHNVAIASASFAWLSGSPGIVAVSSAGLVTGVANGSSIIHATTGGVSGSAVVNVIGDPPVAPTAVADEPAAGSVPGDAFHSALNTPLTSGATTPTLLANDVRGSPLANVAFFGGGSLGGTVTSNAAGSTVTFGTGGSLQVNSDGSFAFTPSTGFTGVFSFSYRIQNSSGTSDAPVTFAVGVRPSAVDDTYPVTIIGNVSINTAVNSHFSILANDAGDGLTITLGVSPNGTTNINADGTFTFNPAPGFSGTAMFSYTVQNGFGTSAAATVSIPVTTPIWFVNASAPAGGDGRIGSPFNCLVDAGSACYDDSANEAGDFIYLATGTYANAAALALKATQRVIGQGAASSLAILTGLVNAADSPSLPATGGTAPLMTSAAAGLVLSTDNQLHGFNVGNTVGAGISGNGFGNLTVRDVNLPGPTRTGQALGLTNGSLVAGSTFRTLVSTSGAAVGVSLENVGGSFVVTGGGSPGTGGTISNASGSAGILLSNVGNVSLSHVIVRDNAGDGISGVNVNGFTLSGSTLQNNGDAATESNVHMTELTGTAGITSSMISNGSSNNVLIENTAGALAFSLSGNTLSSDATKPNARHGLSIVAGGSSVVNASVANNEFQGHRLAHWSVRSSVSAQVQVSVVGNTLTCGNATATACNAELISNSNGTFSYTVQSNVITGMKSVLTLGKVSGTGSMTGSFASNAIGESGVEESGGDGLLVLSSVDGVSHTTSITGNAISNYRIVGIDLLAGVAGSLDATVSTNIMFEPGSGAIHGFRASVGTTPTSTAQMCLAVTNNMLTGSGPLSDFRLIQGGLATMRLPFYVGANNDDAAVVAFVRSLQSLSTDTTPTGIATNTVAGGGGGFVGGVACSQ